MTVPEMMARFSEIPRDLADEPVLAPLGEACDDCSLLARQPSNCPTACDECHTHFM